MDLPGNLTPTFMSPWGRICTYLILSTLNQVHISIHLIGGLWSQLYFLWHANLVEHSKLRWQTSIHPSSVHIICTPLNPLQGRGGWQTLLLLFSFLFSTLLKMWACLYLHLAQSTAVQPDRAISTLLALAVATWPRLLSLKNEDSGGVEHKLLWLLNSKPYAH